MKNFSFPVGIGDTLEFEIDGVTVRGDVHCVSFASYGNSCAVDCDDVFTKNCRKCNLDEKTKCKFFSNGVCDLRLNVPNDCDDIHDYEIGEKYKKVSKSWSIKED